MRTVDTLGLLWGVVWRMVVSGGKLGAGLGALCGMFIGPLGLIVWELQPTALPATQASNTGFFGQLGELLLQVVVGLPLGAVSGLVLGYVAGLF